MTTRLPESSTRSLQLFDGSENKLSNYVNYGNRMEIAVNPSSLALVYASNLFTFFWASSNAHGWCAARCERIRSDFEQRIFLLIFFLFSALSQLYATNCKLQTQLRARDDEACQHSKKKELHWNVSHGLIHLKRGKEKYKSGNWVESLEVTRSKSFWQTRWRFSNAMQQREWRVFLLFDQFSV